MKEAFWGLMIVALGLFGVVAINLFSGVTTDNDRSYYILKESTEGAMYDSIDLAYYRLHGVYRIVEEKFVESVTERFMNNTDSGNYSIVVTDVNELPPKVSLFLKSGVTSIWSNSENISIINGINAIIEAKYPVETITSFLNIDKEEYIKESSKTITNDNYCAEESYSKEDIECITGEIKFEGWDDPTDINGNKLPSAVCSDALDQLVDGYINAKYRLCVCNKWSETKTVKAISAESFYTGTKTNAAKPQVYGSDRQYSWIFYYKYNDVEIKEEYTHLVKLNICTSGINIMVPSNWNTLERLTDSNYTTRGSTSSSYYEPSKDNSSYSFCGSGIRIPVYRDVDGNYLTSYALHLSYNPYNSINRSAKWSSSNGYLTISNTYNPSNSCALLRLNSSGSNCVASAVITATDAAWEQVKNGGEVTTRVTATSLDLNDSTRTRSSAYCDVTLYDGFAKPTCDNLTLDLGTNGTFTGHYASDSPSNANFNKYVWSIADTSIATIDSNSGYITNTLNPGTTTVTISTYKGKYTGTCTLTVNAPVIPSSPTLENYSWTSSSGKAQYKIMYNGTQPEVYVLKSDGKYHPTGQVPTWSTFATPAKEESSGGGGGGSADYRSENTYKPQQGGGTRSNTYYGAQKNGYVAKRCLAEDTLITLYDGTKKKIQDITYDDLILVWNFEAGSFDYEYPIWIKKESTNSGYYIITFDNGNTLTTIGSHSIYSLTDNEFVNVLDSDKFHVGIEVLITVDENLSKTKVESIQYIFGTVNNYYIATNKYYNLFANDILTSDGDVVFLNQYGYTNDLKWNNYNCYNSYLYDKRLYNIDENTYYGLRLNEYKSLVDNGTITFYEYLNIINNFNYNKK